MEQTTLHVEGMSCGHCVHSIEGSLGELNGVNSVKVHLQDHQVDVEYDRQQVSLDKIKEAIDEQGYEVT